MWMTRFLGDSGELSTLRAHFDGGDAGFRALTECRNEENAMAPGILIDNCANNSVDKARRVVILLVAMVRFVFERGRLKLAFVCVNRRVMEWIFQ